MYGELKHKWLIVVAIAIGVITAIVFLILKPWVDKSEEISISRIEIQMQKFETVLPIVQTAFVVVLDESIALVGGEVKHDLSIPFLHNGEMYISLNEAVSFLDATMDIDPLTNIITIESNYCRTQFLADFNILIFNYEPIVLRSKPVQRNGHIFLPVDIIAQILNVSVFRDYSNGVSVLRGIKPLSESDFATILSEMELSYIGIKRNTTLETLNTNVSPDYDFHSLARESRFFVSDSNGSLDKWLLLDDFSIFKERQEVAHKFTTNTVFIAGENANRRNLYIAGSDEIYSLIPDEIMKNDLIYAMNQLIRLKQQAFSNINTDVNVINTINVFGRAVTESFDNSDFINKKNADIQNGVYSTTINVRSFNGESTEIKRQQWYDFCQKAISGDILLFRNHSSDGNYGYFNHAALILSVSEESGELHLLHARDHDLGVGADLPMDRLTFDMMFSDRYWLKYDDIVLCRVEGITSETGREVAEFAYAYFKDYQFGFGGFFGVNETTCVDIIRDSLNFQEIELFENSKTRLTLKRVLEGDAANLILLPDDIVVSSKVKVIDIWTKLD